MRCWRIRSIPLMDVDDQGKPVQVGAFVAYVVAEVMGDIHRVMENSKSENARMAAEQGFSIGEELECPPGQFLYSVRIGLPPLRRSFCAAAPDESVLRQALLHHFSGDDQMHTFIMERVWDAKKIDLSKEGVW